MRLLVFSREFPPGPGGIGTHAYEISRNLVALGWKVTVVTPQDYATDEEVERFNQDQPFEIIRLPSRRGALVEALHRRKVLLHTIRSRQPDVLMASGQRSVWLASRVARRCRLPWIAIGHGTEFGATRGWQHRFTRRAFQRATAVVCVSQFTWQFMSSRGIAPRRGQVIPNGADESRFVPLAQTEVDEFRRQHGHEKSRLLLTVGNVTERKGQEVVIRAMPHILKEEPSTHYLMAGLPTLQRELRELAANLGVAGHVHFLGRIEFPTLLRWVNACDVFAMTSRVTKDGDCEGFGIAVVEAALCGKPAVVSGNSGLAEAIADGETGLIVPQGDATATARQVLKLLTNEPLCRRMGEAAQRRARAEQTWARRSKQYDELLREMLPAPSRDATVHVSPVKVENAQA